MKKDINLLPGDSLIAAGMLSYGGPFTSSFREDFQSNWIELLDQFSITHKPNITMRSLLE